MILKRNRTEDSDARLRLMISRVLSHDMVPEVLARLKIPQLVQFLYEHPNKHVSNEAKKLNRSEDWKTALQLMRKQAMKELGITKAQADRIVAHMERTHTFPEIAGSAINADVIMGDELAADVAEEGGNAGRHGKRGRRSNKELLPAPAAKRKAAALGAGAQPKTVPVPGRKRLRKKLAREDDSPPAIGDQQDAEHAMQERAASEEPRRDVARIRHAEQIPCVAPRSDVDNHPSAAPAAADTEAQNDAPPIKRGRGRPRKAENQRKQEPPPKHRQSPAPERPSPGLSGSSLPAPRASAAAATSAALEPATAPDASTRHVPLQPRRNGASSKDAGGPAAAAQPLPARTGPIAGAERRSRPGRLTMRDVQSLHDSADAACYTSRSPSPPATPLSPMLLPVPPPNSAGAHSPPLPRPITLEAPATNAYLGVPGAHEIPAPIHPPRGRGYSAGRGFHGGRNHGRGQSFARHSAPRPQRRGFFRPKQWPAGPPAGGTPYWQGSAVHPPVWYPPAPPPLQVVARPMALVAQPTTGASNRTS
ncbi:hypothetical protein WJX75_006632 [Coccomyxa subellipsoidea]|uniref:Uncharacterized protein n=1 Tax=Coccomyxa subellipsoidea TaxID=248742 RepID=A0ABR2YD42_9CHLO